MRSGAAGRAGARAAAKLGDRAGAEDAMARGRRVLDRLAEPVHPDHHFVVDPAKADFYAVDVYRWLGADDAAESFAREVLEHSVGPDGTIRAPMRRSEALLTLGTVAASAASWTSPWDSGCPRSATRASASHRCYW